MLCNPPSLRGGERERGGLDLEAEGRQEEVQKERKTRHNICAKNYIKSHKPLALKLTSSRIIQVSNNLHFMKEEVLLS